MHCKEWDDANSELFKESHSLQCIKILIKADSMNESVLP